MSFREPLPSSVVGAALASTMRAVAGCANDDPAATEPNGGDPTVAATVTDTETASPRTAPESASSTASPTGD